MPQTAKKLNDNLFLFDKKLILRYNTFKKNAECGKNLKRGALWK